MAKAKKAAIFGSGPAGLMAASRLASAGVKVTLFEKRPALGRKLLIAGSSGLNITHEATMAEFISHYQGFSPEIWKRWLQVMGAKEWIQFIEALGLETFRGTSSRYFVKEMKASGLLKSWVQDLKARGVIVMPDQEWNSKDQLHGFGAVGFFLGGGSWEDETPPWAARFREEFGLKVQDFYPTNVGYEVAWLPDFLKEAEGQPLKNIVFKTSKGEKAGELMVTRYGLEGTPVYFLGTPGMATIDLKPALSNSEIKAKLEGVTENLSPIRRIKKVLQLSDAALALLFHHTTPQQKSNLNQMITAVKNFKIKLDRPRPLAEAISSGGGVELSEVSIKPGEDLMLIKHPGIFCGGEMLNWTAPTGGFLIQGCVTQGAVAGESMKRFLSRE